MTINPEPDRWQEIKDIWKQNQWLYAFAGFLAGLLAFPFIQALQADVSTFLQSLVPEAISVGFTVFIIETFNRRRETKQEERRLRERLFDELRSNVNGVAARAAEEVKARGWLEDGSLERANLRGIVAKEVDWNLAQLSNAVLVYAVFDNASLFRANLRGADCLNADFIGTSLVRADFTEANLEQARLDGARLKHANFTQANLLGARLTQADGQYVVLRSTNLSRAILHNASLDWSDFEGAILTDALLRNTNLKESNLANANLDDAELEERIILPDGTHWTPDTDMSRFTDPNHPNFWRSDQPRSPAYRGKPAP